MISGAAQRLRSGHNALDSRASPRHRRCVCLCHGGNLRTKVARAREKCKNSNAFGERLKAIMEERGLTQQQVAKVAGVSRAAVSKWLRGTIPGARELFVLAKFLEKPMESFFDGIPYTEPPARVLCADPPGGVPVQFLSAKWRKFYAGMFELMSTPAGIEAFKQTFEKLLPAGGTPQLTPVEKAKQVLTHSSDSVILGPMKSELRSCYASRGAWPNPGE